MTRHRLTLDLSSRFDAELERLSVKGRVTKAEVLRRGLSLLFAMDRAKDDGFTVGAFGELPDGSRLEREFILPT